MPPVSNILTEPLKRVFLEEGEFVLETTSHRRLGSQDEYLESLFANRYTVIPAALQIASESAHMLVGANEAIVFMRLKNLPFRTAFTLSDDANLLFPTYHIEPETGEVTFKDNIFPWPETWGSLWFTETFVLGGGTPRPGSCYLVSYREGEFYHTNYPNIFNNDGRVCMGRDWDSCPHGNQPTVAQRFMHAYMSFVNTPMNSDLRTNHTASAYARHATGEHEGKWLAQTDPSIRPPSSLLTCRILPEMAKLIPLV